MGFLGIGGWEVVLIIVLALIILGPNKLNDFARTAGKTVRAIRKASTDLTTAVTRELNAVQDEPGHLPPGSQPKTAPARASAPGPAPAPAPTFTATPPAGKVPSGAAPPGQAAAPTPEEPGQPGGTPSADE